MPSTISSSVVLPDPFGPMTPTMAPAGIENVPSDQTDPAVRGPRSTSSSTSAGSPRLARSRHTQAVAQPAELVDLPVHEARRRPAATVSVTSTTGTPARSAAARSCSGTAPSVWRL